MSKLRNLQAKNDLQRELLRIANAGLALNIQGFAPNGQPLADVVTAELNRMAETAGDTAALEAVGRKMREAADDPSKRAELNAQRVYSSNNFLPAMFRTAGAFFRIENLSPGELPSFKNESLEEETPVNVISIDGEGAARRVVKKQEITHYSMDLLWTDKVQYMIKDWTQTAVIQSALKTIDLNRAMARKIDALTFAEISKAVNSGGLFGDFTLTGSKPSRVFVTDSAVKSANLPTGNDITLNSTFYTNFKLTGTANSTTTNFRDDVFRAILAYEAAWGGLLGEGPLFTGEILIPSIDVISIANGLGIGDAAGSDVKEGIVNNGYARVRFLGRDFTLIGDPTLAPNVCYPVPVNKPGVIFFRPDMDDEEVVTHKRKNLEERALGKAFKAIIPVHQRVNALRIRYRTAA